MLCVSSRSKFRHCGRLSLEGLSVQKFFIPPIHNPLLPHSRFSFFNGTLILTTIAETSDCKSASANKSRNIIVLHTSSENTKSPRRHHSVIYCVLSARTARRVTARPHERIAHPLSTFQHKWRVVYCIYKELTSKSSDRDIRRHIYLISPRSLSYRELSSRQLSFLHAGFYRETCGKQVDEARCGVPYT